MSRFLILPSITLAPDPLQAREDGILKRKLQVRELQDRHVRAKGKHSVTRLHNAPRYRLVSQVLLECKVRLDMTGMPQVYIPLGMGSSHLLIDIGLRVNLIGGDSAFQMQNVQQRIGLHDGDLPYEVRIHVIQ